MIALLVLESVVLVAVVVLLVGLLRTHAEVLRRLHDLGAGLDPAASTPTPAPLASPPVAEQHADVASRVAPGVAAPNPGPPLPVDVARLDLAGRSPRGSSVAVNVSEPGRLTLVAFLTTGCTTCAGFWQALRAGERLELPDGRRPRVVVVTRGAEYESPAAVATLAGPELTVVMSSDAWTTYRVPASPYFALVDGAAGVVGEGASLGWDQLARLLGRAVLDRRDARTGPGGAGGPTSERDNATRIDAELRRAGIEPGDPRLYDWSDAATKTVSETGAVAPRAGDARPQPR